MHREKNIKKVIILGIDAMDPRITEKLIQEGNLPNFSYLKTIGAYSHLKTTVPAESVVAWTSFSTGLNPAGHGIFDFIMRNPQNYLPYLSLSDISNVRGKIEIKMRRRGDAFWDVLSRNKIPCFIYFCPNTFPAQPLLGKMLSGMGTPDLSGTMGKFSFYTTSPLSEEDKDSRGRIIQVKSKNNVIETKIYGPKMTSGGSIVESTAPLRITFVPDGKSISVTFQKNNFLLSEANWSSWQSISFNVGLFKKAYGITRFYLKSINPEFELYLSPINFHPQKPLFPISYPKNYSNKLAQKAGLYYTQGMPQDTWALTENRLDEKAFLELADQILKEKEKILTEGLKEFKGGVFFFYFDTLDTVQHMFWRYLDIKHPLYEEDSLYRDTIFNYYGKIDRILGEVLKNMDKNTVLIVLSDHGFGSFRKSVHLNRWLLEHGYLHLKEGLKESKEFFEDVDWSMTKAYALGFGGIYLNKVGREYYGIVSESEAQELKQRIKENLEQLKDAENGEMIVRNVYTQEEIFNGPCAENGPDLFVGFNEGYRASWQTALGGIPAGLIEHNKKKWSGDHLVDSDLVPGVIFLNKKAELKDPAILDIAPSILALFNIHKPNGMEGKSLFENENRQKE